MTSTAYKSAVTAMLQERRRQKEAWLQRHAEDGKPKILKLIEQTLPVFWSIHQADLEAATPAWWNADPQPQGGSFYGLPGVVVWGHLFIGARRESDTNRIYVGVWPSQDSPTYQPTSSQGKSVACRGPVQIQEMPEDRILLEQEFCDHVECAMNLITSASKQAFPNWSGPGSSS